MRSIALCLLLLLLPLEALAGPRVVSATGYGIIVEGKVATARQRAIEDGLRRIIKRVLKGLVGEEVFVQNLPAFAERFLLQPSAFMESYRIKDESEGEGIYRVEVEGRVSERLIRKVLKGLDAMFGRQIKVLLMIVERDRGELPRYWWSGLENSMGPMERVMKEELMVSGFMVIDPFLGSPERIPLELRTPILKEEEIKEVGDILGADLIIYGDVTAEEEIFPFSLLNRKKGRVSFRLRAFYRGKEVDRYSSYIAIPDMEDFTLKGSPLIYERLMEKARGGFIAPLIKELKNGKEGVIKVTFKGVTSYSQYRSIVEGLKDMESVGDIRVESFSQGGFTLTLKLGIPPSSFVEILEEMDWKGFALRPYKVSPSMVGLQVMDEREAPFITP